MAEFIKIELGAAYCQKCVICTHQLLVHMFNVLIVLLAVIAEGKLNGGT